MKATQCYLYLIMLLVKGDRKKQLTKHNKQPEASITNDLGTNILAGNFVDFLNRFILRKSSEHSSHYINKHLKGLYGNIGILISGNSLSPEVVSDISNLGFLSSNWNSRNIKDYGKNSSDTKLVLENLKLKINNRLVIGNLNINSMSNKFDNFKIDNKGQD